MNSWPAGQWFDDSDELFDGKEPTDAEPADDAVVVFTCGNIYNESGEGWTTLTKHFAAWQKQRARSNVLCDIPTDKLEELKVFLTGVGGKVLLT